jgi:hypothetical protein
MKNVTFVTLILVTLTLMSCGKNHDNNPNLVDLNQETIVVEAPRATLSIETCESLQAEERCNCLDRVAYNHCSRLMKEANNKYTECISPFLTAAYSNYCSVNAANAYSDADRYTFAQRMYRYQF